jgi:hypothetical protein
MLNTTAFINRQEGIKKISKYLAISDRKSKWRIRRGEGY